MNRTVTAILGILALALLPAMAMAKSHNGGKGNQPGGSSGPASSSSAYEHADEKAKFMRDTHDLGEHKGEVKPDDRDQQKDKDKDQDQTKDQEKAKAKSKEKAKGGESAGAEQGKDNDKNKNKKGQSDTDQLFEQGRKTKEDKVK